MPQGIIGNNRLSSEQIVEPVNVKKDRNFKGTDQGDTKEDPAQNMVILK